MELEWEESNVYRNTYYCGSGKQGYLTIIDGTWVWTRYPKVERPRLKVNLGPDFETVQRCVEAMIWLDG